MLVCVNGNNLQYKVKGDNKNMTQLNEQEMKLVELISEGCKTPNDITS